MWIVFLALLNCVFSQTTFQLNSYCIFEACAPTTSGSPVGVPTFVSLPPVIPPPVVVPVTMPPVIPPPVFVPVGIPVAPVGVPGPTPPPTPIPTGAGPTLPPTAFPTPVTGPPSPPTMFPSGFPTSFPTSFPSSFPTFFPTNTPPPKRKRVVVDDLVVVPLGAPSLGAPSLGAPSLGAPSLGAPSLGAPSGNPPVPIPPNFIPTFPAAPGEMPIEAPPEALPTQPPSESAYSIWTAPIVLGWQQKSGNIQQLPVVQLNRLFNTGKRIFEMQVEGETYVIYQRIDGQDIDLAAVLSPSPFKLVDHVLGVNCNLYSTRADLLAGTNAWTSCVFDTPGVAFPAQCSPNPPVGCCQSYDFDSLPDSTRVFIYLEDPSDCPTPQPVVLYTPTSTPYPNALELYTEGLVNPDYSEIDFMTCTDCGAGTEYEAGAGTLTRDNYFHTACPVIEQSCSACVFDYSDPDAVPSYYSNCTNCAGPPNINASSSQSDKISYIYDLLTHDKPFQQALSQRVPGQNVTFYLILFKKRQSEVAGIGINYTNCSDLPAVVSFTNNFLTTTVPQAGYLFAFSGCDVGIVSTTSNPLVYLAFLSLLSLLLLVVLFVVYRLYQRQFIQQLPKEVAWSFLQYKDSLGIGWKKFYGGSAQSLYYYKEYAEGSAEWKKVSAIFRGFFYGEELKIDAIRAVYNPTLLRSFINFWKLTETRFINDHQVFFDDLSLKNNEQQQWILEQYQKLTSSCVWNKDLMVPIIPALHGTDFSLAEKIGQTGFANLSALDDGFFGKGIYFSTFAPYILPYFGTRVTPSVLICYLNLGHVYPVFESHTGPDKLCGQQLKGGFTSHYVCVYKHGSVLEGPVDTAFYDEIVISQEAQIVPAFIVKINKETALEQVKLFDRENPVRRQREGFS